MDDRTRQEIDNWLKTRFDRATAGRGERTLGSHTCLLDGNSLKYIEFSSNDYLGLATHPRILTALDGSEYSASSASRVVSGSHKEHFALEQGLSEWMRAEAALLFGAGYLANIGLLSGVVSRHDIVVSDRLIHASLHDGVCLSGARHRRFRHNDLAHLEEVLSREHRLRKPGNELFVVVEAVYSMDGDSAPLPELVEVCSRVGAHVIVDEAHSLGVYGEHGEGFVAEHGLEDAVFARVGTCSKALANYGGVVAGSELLIKYLVNTSRSFIYNTALPPAVVRGTISAIELIKEQAGIGKEVLKKAAFFRDHLSKYGVGTSRSTSHIVPVILGCPHRALDIAHELDRRGIRVKRCAPPQFLLEPIEFDSLSLHPIPLSSLSLSRPLWPNY